MKKKIYAIILTALMVTACVTFTGCGNAEQTAISTPTETTIQANSTEETTNSINTKEISKKPVLGNITNLLETIEDNYKSKKVNCDDIEKLSNLLLDLQMNISSENIAKDEAAKSTVKYVDNVVSKIDIESKDIVVIGDKAKLKENFNIVQSVTNTLKAEFGLNSADEKTTMAIVTDSTQVNKGKTMQASVAFSKDKDIKNLKITWKSDNEKVIKVDSKGKITGVATGKATISATTSDGLSAYLEIECVAENVKVETKKTTAPTFTNGGTYTVYTPTNDNGGGLTVDSNYDSNNFPTANNNTGSTSNSNSNNNGGTTSNNNATANSATSKPSNSNTSSSKPSTSNSGGATTNNNAGSTSNNSTASSKPSTNTPSGGATSSTVTHSHNWQPVYKTVTVTDKAAYDEKVEKKVVDKAVDYEYYYIRCSCGKKFGIVKEKDTIARADWRSLIDEWQSHSDVAMEENWRQYDILEASGATDSQLDDFLNSMNQHSYSDGSNFDHTDTVYKTVTETVHHNAVTHTEKVIDHYECSCGATK